MNQRKKRTVYSYDPITKIFIGEDNAWESPLEPGVYLIPAHATEVAVPEIPNNKLAVWENDTWVIKDIPQNNNIFKNDQQTPPQPLPWDYLKKIRNQYLSDSDWVVLPDSNPTNKQAWLEYRQQLRDLPQKFTNPEDVIWPERP